MRILEHIAQTCLVQKIERRISAVTEHKRETVDASNKVDIARFRL